MWKLLLLTLRGPYYWTSSREADKQRWEEIKEVGAGLACDNTSVPVFVGDREADKQRWEEIKEVRSG